MPASEVYWDIIDCLKLHSALQHMPQLLEGIVNNIKDKPWGGCLKLTPSLVNVSFKLIC